jgi:hypothetical protein
MEFSLDPNESQKTLQRCSEVGRNALRLTELVIFRDAPVRASFLAVMLSAFGIQGMNTIASAAMTTKLDAMSSIGGGEFAISGKFFFTVNAPDSDS